ncbi:(Fe-S)-binding protein [Clostridium sp. chh4-2]|nr:(Fe-S)-binding protein [Clostridium sp. chh4-2]
MNMCWNMIGEVGNMKVIKTKAVFDEEKCIGCTVCSKVCPADAIRFVNKKPVLEEEHCVGCSSCVEHCPKDAVKMEALENPRTIFCDPSKFEDKAIEELCLKAHFYPKMEICVCTRTKAEEVAAAILAGAKTPIDLARMTGIRTGCKCCCAETPLRMLNAAGIDPGEAPGYQWYGLTSTLWTMDEAVKEEYDGKYHFKDDIEFCEKCVEKGLERGSGYE